MHWHMLTSIEDLSNSLVGSSEGRLIVAAHQFFTDGPVIGLLCFYDRCFSMVDVC